MNKPVTTPREGLFHVRQYRPSYCTGFTNSVLRNVAWGQILTAPWLEDFRSSPDFLHFSIETNRSDEMFLMANFKKERWVAGFVLSVDSCERAPDGGLLRDNWRYQEHQS